MPLLPPSLDFSFLLPPLARVAFLWTIVIPDSIQNMLFEIPDSNIQICNGQIET